VRKVADKKRTLGIVALFSVAGALAYWLYLYITDRDSAPTFSDVGGWLYSLPVRGYLIVRGQIESALGSVGGSPDPVVIAAGLIAGFEGFVGHVYADPPGQTITYSIGYGHQLVAGDGFDQSSTISQTDALALLQSDLANYVSCVNAAVTVSLTPDQLAALYSFTYNEGCGAFQGSTLLQDINAGNFDAAVADFSSWDIAGGQVSQALVNRRQSESNLFASAGNIGGQSGGSAPASGDTTASNDDSGGDDNG
jgi:GH24 family phage-related lysozyme (muramidase)